MSDYSGFNDEMGERTASRIMFVSDIVWEVLPETKDRAKPKNIVSENAENYYIRNRIKFLDDPSNDVLTETDGKDSWLKASYIRNYWADIRDYLFATGRGIDYNRSGCYRTENDGDIQKLHERRARVVKKMGERLTYRAILYNEATHGNLPGVVTQVLQLEQGN